MLMPERNGGGNCGFGFNGMEKDASIWDGQSTTYSEKIMDKNDSNKTWVVTYNVRYVYDENVEQSLSKLGLTDPKSYSKDELGSTFEKVNNLRESGKLEEAGVSRSSNILMVDSRVKTGTGELGQAQLGGTLGFVGGDRQGYLAGKATRDHEVSHLMGYDERYNTSTLKYHEGFKYDMMSNTIPSSSKQTNPMSAIHLVDLLDFALKNGIINGTITVGNTGGGKGKPYDSTYRVDGTNHGQTEESSSSIEAKKKRVQ